MMSEIFLTVLNLSVTGSFVALAVMLLRLALRRAPRFVSCLLWALVSLRLVCPVAVESSFSLLPRVDTVAVSDAVSDAVQAGGEHTAGSSAPNYADTHTNTSAPEANNGLPQILSVVWAVGVGAMLLYGVGSYVMLRFRVRDSVPLVKNIRQSEKVESPFILGIVKPRIYLPFNIDNKTKKYVLLHEQAHLGRFDHLTKPFGFLLVAVYWFNPIIWLSYMLLCRDIEVACDEKVIKDMSIKSRKAYATALLDCKVSRRTLAACPVAFGEVGVGERIKKTLAYKKPAVWIVAFAVVCCVAASACLLTDPVAAAEAEKAPLVESHRVTAGYTEPAPTETALVTEPPTTSPTEPPTESPTEVQADPYEEEYYDYGYSNEPDDSYEESDEDSFMEVLRTVPPNPEPEIVTMAPVGEYSLLDGISTNKFHHDMCTCYMCYDPWDRSGGGWQYIWDP